MCFLKDKLSEEINGLISHLAQLYFFFLFAGLPEILNTVFNVFVNTH